MKYEWFAYVYRLVEALAGRSCTDLDIQRAYLRYCKIMERDA